MGMPDRFDFNWTIMTPSPVLTQHYWHQYTYRYLDRYRYFQTHTYHLAHSYTYGCYNWPLFSIKTRFTGRPDGVPKASICFTISIPVKAAENGEKRIVHACKCAHRHTLKHTHTYTHTHTFTHTHTHSYSHTYSLSRSLSILYSLFLFFYLMLLLLKTTTHVYNCIQSPWMTEPKTTCLPSNHGVGAVQIKNCEPLVPGPALAMDNVPIEVWWWSNAERKNLGEGGNIKQHGKCNPPCANQLNCSYRQTGETVYLGDI